MKNEWQRMQIPSSDSNMQYNRPVLPCIDSMYNLMPPGYSQYQAQAFRPQFSPLWAPPSMSLNRASFMQGYVNHGYGPVQMQEPAFCSVVMNQIGNNSFYCPNPMFLPYPMSSTVRPIEKEKESLPDVNKP